MALIKKREIAGELMRTLIFALLLVACPGAANSQTTTQNDVERSVRVLLTGLSSGMVWSMAEKPITRFGDSASVAITKIFSDREPTPPEMYNALTVIRIAFARPSIVEVDSDRSPRTTLLLLRYMELLTENADLRENIADIRQFVVDQTKPETASPDSRVQR